MAQKPRFFFCVVEDLRQRTLMRKKPIENLLQFIKEFAIIMIPKQTALKRLFERILYMRKKNPKIMERILVFTDEFQRKYRRSPSTTEIANEEEIRSFLRTLVLPIQLFLHTFVR